MKKYLIKIKIYKYYHNIKKESNNELSIIIQKPAVKICHITKFINKANLKRISFINKKI